MFWISELRIKLASVTFVQQLISYKIPCNIHDAVDAVKKKLKELCYTTAYVSKNTHAKETSVTQNTYRHWSERQKHSSARLLML